VLANLLNNAAKYTPEGGNISLSVFATGREVELVVQDNGNGMAPELVARVFDLFAQAERTSDRSQGGLGLGLALARSLVELHGGAISAVSAGEQRGSTFRVRLPRVQSGAGAPLVEAPVHGPAAAPLQVLVVDDNADAANTLQAVLEAVGHSVAVCYNGAQALVRAQAHAPQLCLLDIGLPDISGLLLAPQLRALPRMKGAVIVAVTGYGRAEDRAKAASAGFDHYLVKPLDVDALFALIAAVMPQAALTPHAASTPPVAFTPPV
jgi:CheY-like chemotaxis protein